MGGEEKMGGWLVAYVEFADGTRRKAVVPYGDSELSDADREHDIVEAMICDADKDVALYGVYYTEELSSWDLL